MIPRPCLVVALILACKPGCSAGAAGRSRGERERSHCSVGRSECDSLSTGAILTASGVTGGEGLLAAQNRALEIVAGAAGSREALGALVRIVEEQAAGE